MKTSKLSGDSSTPFLGTSLAFLKEQSIRKTAESVKFTRAYLALTDASSKSGYEGMLIESVRFAEDALAYLLMESSGDGLDVLKRILSEFGLDDILSRKQE